MSVDKTQQSREETREELAETLEALAHKADVKGRAKVSAQHAVAEAKQKVDPRAAGIGLGAVVVVVLLLVLRKRRNR
ncbi:MAG: DUF3618 domain-containing protein [Actinomycetota bacterium]|nr:DUF3618 domain-containing protein [Actinomycetota bacterium]